MLNIIIIVIHHLNYLTIHYAHCLFQYVVVANCVLCVFHREWTSEGQATYRHCFSIDGESILLLLGSSNEGIVVRCSPIFTVRLIKCTIRQSPVLRLPRVLRQSALLCLLLLLSYSGFVGDLIYVPIFFFSTNCTCRHLTDNHNLSF